VHHWEQDVEHWFDGALEAIGGAAAWAVNTLASAVLGLLVGAVALVVMHLVPARRSPRARTEG
jgi:predicted DNA repair protein MutK